jgi:hypothetical protein
MPVLMQVFIHIYWLKAADNTKEMQRFIGACTDLGRLHKQFLLTPARLHDLFHAAACPPSARTITKNVNARVAQCASNLCAAFPLQITH